MRCRRESVAHQLFSLSKLAEPQTCHHRKEKNQTPELRLARRAKPIKVSFNPVQFGAANHPTCGPLLILRKSEYYGNQTNTPPTPAAASVRRLLLFALRMFMRINLLMAAFKSHREGKLQIGPRSPSGSSHLPLPLIQMLERGATTEQLHRPTPATSRSTAAFPPRSVASSLRWPQANFLNCRLNVVL